MANYDDLSFDDLVPQQGSTKEEQDSGGGISFDDLIPSPGTQAPSGAVDTKIAAPADILPSKEEIAAEYKKLGNPYNTTGNSSKGFQSALLMQEAAGIGDALPMIAYKETGHTAEARQQLAEYAAKQQFNEKNLNAPAEGYTEAWRNGKSLSESISNVEELAKYDAGQALGSWGIDAALMVGTTGLGAAEVGARRGAQKVAKYYADLAIKKIIEKDAATFLHQGAVQYAGNYTQMLQETGEDHFLAAAAITPITVMLDRIPEVNTLRKALPPEMSKLLGPSIAKAVIEKITLKKLPKELLKIAGTEGATEALQDATVKIANKFVSDNYTLFTSEHINDTLRNFSAGFVGGAHISGMMHLPSATAHSLSKHDEANDAGSTNLDEHSFDAPEDLPPPEQRLPKRPSIEQFTTAGEDAQHPNTKAKYQEARDQYVQFFKDQFGKSPEKYYRDQAAEQEKRVYPKYQPLKGSDKKAPFVMPSNEELQAMDNDPLAELRAKWEAARGLPNSSVKQPIAYHATDKKIEGPFRFLTHFGSTESSNERAANLVAFERATGKDGMSDFQNFHTHPVDLDIKNSIRIVDDGGLRTADDFGMALWKAEHITRAELDEILRDNVTYGREPLKKLMEKKGWDGFVYKNTVEGKGTDSYVPLHPDKQVISKITGLPINESTDHLHIKQPIPQNADTPGKLDIDGMPEWSVPFEDSRRMAPHLKGVTSVNEGLLAVAANTKVPFFKQLAEDLHKVLGHLDYPVNWVSKHQMETGLGISSDVREELRGARGAILHPGVLGKNKASTMVLNDDSFHPRVSGMNEATFLHEAIHLATLSQLYNTIANIPNWRNTDLFTDVDSIRQTVWNALDAIKDNTFHKESLSPEAIAWGEHVLSSNTEKELAYKLGSVHEFLSYSLTDGALFEFMKNLPYDQGPKIVGHRALPKTPYHRFLDFLYKIFKVAPRDRTKFEEVIQYLPRSALDAAHDSTQELFKRFSDKEFKSVLGKYIFTDLRGNRKELSAIKHQISGGGPSMGEEFLGGVDPNKATPLNPDELQRNIENLTLTTQFKQNNLALPKALDNLIRTVANNPELSPFQQLAETPAEVSADIKTNLMNLTKLSMNIIRGRAKAHFKTNPVAVESLFHFLSDPASGFLSQRESVLLDKSRKTIIDKLALKTGINIRDLQLNFSDQQKQAMAFTYFLQQRYEGKVAEGWGPATEVFNKMDNLIFKMGQIMNANKVLNNQDLFSKITDQNVNNALYAMNATRNQKWTEKRMGDTLYETEEIFKGGKDHEFDHLLTFTNPGDIKHITYRDFFASTMQQIATKYPWAAPVIQYFRGKLERISQISKQIGTIPRDILVKRPANFHIAHQILNAGRKNADKAKITTLANGDKILHFTNMNGQRRKVVNQKIIEDFEAIRENYRKTIEEDEMSFRQDMTKMYGIPAGASVGEIRAYANSLNEDLKAAGPTDPIRHTLEKQKEHVNDIARALENINKLKNIDYVPHLRFGKLATMVFKRSNDPNVEDELVFLGTLEESMKGKTIAEREQELQKRLAPYRNNLDYYIVGGNPKGEKERLVHNEILKRIPPQHISMELIYSLMGSDQSAEAAKEMADLLKGKLLETRMAFYLRPSSNIDGYSTDYPRVMETWVHARSINQANKEADGRWGEIEKYMVELEKKGNEGGYNLLDIKFLKDYVEYNRNRSTDLMMLRSANFLYAMGLRLKSAVLQLFNGPQALVPLLTLGGGSFGHNLAAWTRAFKDASKIHIKLVGKNSKYIQDPTLWAELVKHGVLTKEEAELGRTFGSSHLSESILLDENTGCSYETIHAMGKFLKGAHLTAQLAGGMISTGEQVSRLSTIITIAREFSNPEVFNRIRDSYEGKIPGTKVDPGWEGYRDWNNKYTTKESLAFYLMEKTHGQYGKAGRGWAQRGMQAAIAFPFATQSLTQWELIKDLAMNRGNAGKIGAMYMLGTYMALCGLMGLPFYTVAKDLYNLYDALENALRSVPKPARDFDIDLRRWLENALGPNWANIVEKGPLRQLTGVDLTSSVNLPTSFELLAAKPMDALIDTLNGKTIDLNKVAPPALTITQPPPVWRDLTVAINDMNPDNPLGGLKTRQGNIVQPSKDPKTGQPTYNAGQRVARGLGFTPTEEAENRQAVYERTVMENQNKARAGKIVDRAIEARAKMIDARNKGNTDLETTYRNEISTQRKNWINFQKSIGNKYYNVDNFNSSVLRGAKEYKTGSESRTKYIKKQQEDIRRRSIYDYGNNTEE